MTGLGHIFFGQYTGRMIVRFEYKVRKTIMKATASNENGTGRPVTAFAMREPAIAPARNIVPDRRAANADDFHPKFPQVVEAAAARVGRAIAGFVQGLRDDAERRRTVRELRRLGRSRLADIGIEPNDIERVVAGMVAARRSRSTNSGRRRPAPGSAAPSGTSARDARGTSPMSRTGVAPDPGGRAER